MISKPKWKIDFSQESRKLFKKLDKPIKKRIVDYLEHKVASLDNPKDLGKPLDGNFKGFWCYRVAGDYRVMCDIQNDKLVVLVVLLGHRKNIYETKH